MEAEFNKARQMAVKKAAERDVLQEAGMNAFNCTDTILC